MAYNIYYNEESESPAQRRRQVQLYKRADLYSVVTFLHQGTFGRFQTDVEKDYASGVFLTKLKKALPLPPDAKFAAHFEKLAALAIDQTLWVEGAEPPSSLTMVRARAILQQLQVEALEPTRVVGSAEGGVAFCFVSGDKYSDIECLNTDVILGVISNRRDRPFVWEIEPSASGIAQAAARIRDFIQGATASSHDAKW